MLKEFQGESVTFVETTHVKEGVLCDVYIFDGDSSKDLGIVTVAPNTMTPKQRVLQGEKTIEGYLDGEATFVVNGHKTLVTEASEFEINVGDSVQWQAGAAGLKFYEICYPPYQDGRFENLPE